MKSTTCKSSGRVKQIVFGLIIVALGIALITRNTGTLSPYWSNLIFSWQMLIIALGFINLFSRSSIVFGLITMAVGGFFLLPQITLMPDGFANTYWPFFIIIIGILIIYFSFKRFKKVGHRRESVSDEELDDVFIFSGGERVVASKRFKGGKSINIFGGSVYDMTKSDMEEGVHVLELICILGGVELIIPADWNVKIEALSVLGGFEQKRRESEGSISPNKTLLIKGVLVLGGGEIKSR